MPAPSGTQWCPISGDGTRQGRIGVYITLSSTQTETTVSAQVWFWTKYSCYDNNNEFWVGVTGEASSLNRGSHNINHTVESGGGWSTSNQTLIGTYTARVTRGTSARTLYCNLGFFNIEAAGGSGGGNIAYTVPARNQYSISYNANGGSGAPPTQYYYYGYDTTLSSTIPTRAGYTFMGWSLSNTATEPSYYAGQAWSGTNASNYTLYAVWERKAYAVTFDAGTNGGLVNGGITMTVNYTYGSTLSSLPTAIRNNYNFLGWNTRANGTGTYITNSTVITSAMTVYAIFEVAANAYVKQSGTYRAGMTHVKYGGSYEVGEVYVKRNGTYQKGGA